MKQPQITLEKARALYAQGGMARQVALARFSESDLKEPNWPKSWLDLSYINGCYIRASSQIFSAHTDPTRTNINVAPSKSDCENILAFCQLRQLAERMNDGWEPSERNRGYTVNYFFNGGLKATSTHTSFKELIVFKTRDMAEFSLNHHKDLWEKYWKVK